MTKHSPITSTRRIRRGLLVGGTAVAAASLLTGCSIGDIGSVISQIELLLHVLSGGGM